LLWFHSTAGEQYVSLKASSILRLILINLWNNKLRIRFIIYSHIRIIPQKSYYARTYYYCVSTVRKYNALLCIVYLHMKLIYLKKQNNNNWRFLLGFFCFSLPFGIFWFPTWFCRKTKNEKTNQNFNKLVCNLFRWSFDVKFWVLIRFRLIGLDLAKTICRPDDFAIFQCVSYVFFHIFFIYIYSRVRENTLTEKSFNFLKSFSI